MELPPKALFVLIDIKKALLSKEMPPSDVVIEPDKPKKQRFNGRQYARQSTAFQRGCQRRAPWSPVH